CSRRRLCPYHLGDHRRRRRRPPGMGHHQYLCGHRLTGLRVVPVDDDTGGGVDPAPERERLVEAEDGAAPVAGDEGRHHVITASPATALSTQSLADPNTTRTPRLAGA